MAGYLPGSFSNDIYFVQVVLAIEFRGRGLAGTAEDLLAKKHKLPTLTATIEKSNIASLKSHLNAGFKELDQEKLNSMREKGFLKENQTRLVKRYR